MRKRLSVETILSARTHALTHRGTAHTSILTIQNLIYTQLKTGTNRDLRWMKTAAGNTFLPFSLNMGTNE